MKNPFSIMSPTSKFISILILISLPIAGFLIGVSLSKNNVKQSVPTVAISITPSTIPTPSPQASTITPIVMDPYEGWLDVKSVELGISFKVPPKINGYAGYDYTDPSNITVKTITGGSNACLKKIQKDSSGFINVVKYCRVFNDNNDTSTEKYIGIEPKPHEGGQHPINLFVDPNDYNNEEVDPNSTWAQHKENSKSRCILTADKPITILGKVYNVEFLNSKQTIENYDYCLGSNGIGIFQNANDYSGLVNAGSSSKWTSFFIKHLEVFVDDPTDIQKAPNHLSQTARKVLESMKYL